MENERPNVLLVEDHPAMRAALRGYLNQLGYSTVEASNGDTAIDLLSRCSPELVCLDLCLPESSGYEICEFIRRSRHRDVPVLMISGRALPEDRAHAVEVGVNAFLAKPFDTKEFAACVRKLLNRDGAGAGARD